MPLLSRGHKGIVAVFVSAGKRDFAVCKAPRGSKGREVKKWVVVTTPRCVEVCFGVVAHLSFRGAGHLKPQSGCVPRNGRASQFSTLYVRDFCAHIFLIQPPLFYLGYVFSIPQNRVDFGVRDFTKSTPR